MKFAGRKLTWLTAVAVLLLLTAGAVAVLDWRQAQRQNAFIDYVRTNAVPLVAGGDNSNLEGHLVYSVGTPRTSSPLKDPLFGFELDALSVERTAQINQWVEYRDGGITYKREWVKRPISSDKFARLKRHENVGTLDVKERSERATLIDFNGVKLDAAYLELMHKRRLPVNDDMYMAMPAPLRDQYQLVNGHLLKRFVRNDDARANVEVGDTIVKFSGIRPALVLVIGKLEGGTIRPMDTPYGRVAILEPGRRSLEQVYAKLTPGTSFATIALGVIAFVMALFGVFTFRHDFATAPRIIEVFRFGRQSK